MADTHGYIASSGSENAQNENESIPISVHKVDPSLKLGVKQNISVAKPWLAMTKMGIARSMFHGLQFSGKPYTRYIIH